MATLEELEAEIRNVSEKSFPCFYCKVENQPLVEKCVSCKKKTYREKMLFMLLRKYNEVKEGKKPGIVASFKRWFGF